MIKITSSKVKRSGIELTKGLFVNCTSNAIAHLVVAIYNDDGYKLSSPYAKLVLEDIRDEVHDYVLQYVDNDLPLDLWRS